MSHDVVIVGAQWGDEGKGKVVDYFTENAHAIVRYQGGNNAGHTLVVKGKKTVLHLIPSGVLHERARCYLGQGMVLDPAVFFREIDALQANHVFSAAGPEARVRVSGRCHVIFPFHIEADQGRETSLGAQKIGTTGRGIGPTYEDKISRRGVMVYDLMNEDRLRMRLESLASLRNFDLEEMIVWGLSWGRRLAPFVEDVGLALDRHARSNEIIVYEGAQGVMLDIDHGTYPFVTSSSTVLGGAFTGAGKPPSRQARVVGITKAYTTRVGSGPFPSEIEISNPELAEKIRKNGNEFGSTTGRARRIGWLDLVQMRYAIRASGITEIALMKADVLAGLDFVKVITSYRLGALSLHEYPSDPGVLDQVHPEGDVLPSWGDDVLNDPDFAAFRDLVARELGVPVSVISYGPDRSETWIQSAE